MPKRAYPRDKGGHRLQFGGIDTVHPPDSMPPHKFPHAQNLRSYLKDRVTGRATQDAELYTVPGSVHTLRRLNDTTPNGPLAGFVIIGGAGPSLFVNAANVQSGFSGNPLSLVPFRPNTSVQPWMYVGDSVQMVKVRSDGTAYAMGVMEPQDPPSITSTPISVLVSLLGPVTVYVWNAANGDSSGANGTPFIWRNPTDTSGRGPIETTATAALSTTGNSLMFDDGVSPAGSYAIPVQWTQFATGIGTVSTSGVDVTWNSGSQFNELVAGETIIINLVEYTIAASPAPTNTTLSVTSSAGTQTAVNYYYSVPNGTVTLYTPALSSDGYVFNAAILGTLYVPAAGTYTITATYVNDIIFGIGNSGTGTAKWTNNHPISNAGQTKTVVNEYPLLPRTTTIDGNGYSQGTASVAVTFSAAGNYPIEIDWNYGNDQHASPARTMFLQCNGKNIAPLPGTAISESQYRYTYRSSATGATSNPSPESPEQVLAVLANTLTATPSTDPQVDKIDFYRLDAGLTNFTYVGTGPNTSASFTDQLLDADVAENPILAFDNYQPFPSIDLPRKGVVNVDSSGTANWVSGDQFNIRWLAGTVIIVGTLAYTLDKRPTSTTQLTASTTQIIGGVTTLVPLAFGANQTYEIDEPILAAQPLPYIWGPTDNVNFAFGVGDPLRPGTLYWCKGNNLDSAPDTNQQDLTSPSEPLQNGCIVNGMGLVFSTERAFLILPNFFNALATVQGTVGSTWTIQESISTRGLYIPRALAVDGGGNVFFRAKDGIMMSPGGQGARSITDGDIYNLFPHEGMVPQPVKIGNTGLVVFPPDDSQPQQMHCADGYLYYDYLYNGVQQTLVFDIAAMGWVVDVYQYPVVTHVLEEGPNVNGTLTGCADGSVRPLTNTGAEIATSVLIMPCDVAGDVRAQKHWSDVYIEGEQEVTLKAI